MKSRVIEIDYLKGVFILLMVLFHIQYIEELYPTLRQAVYTFHMSAFLVISGYLANVNKSPAEFGKSISRLIVPYVLFEILYVSLLYALRGEGMTHVIQTDGVYGFSMLMSHVLTRPSGPYWYLHTLIVCMVAYYLVSRCSRLSRFSRVVVLGVALYLICSLKIGVAWANVWYFLIGVVLSVNGVSFTRVFYPSVIALVPLIVLFSDSANFSRASLAGIMITGFVICLLLFLWQHIGSKVGNVLCWIGRNSLSIVVFSPIFTVTAKFFRKYLMFDSTGILFAIVAVCFVVIGCLSCAWMSDKLRISRILFVKKAVYTRLRQ